MLLSTATYIVFKVRILSVHASSGNLLSIITSLKADKTGLAHRFKRTFQVKKEQTIYFMYYSVEMCNIWAIKSNSSLQGEAVIIDRYFWNPSRSDVKVLHRLTDLFIVCSREAQNQCPRAMPYYKKRKKESHRQAFFKNIFFSPLKFRKCIHFNIFGYNPNAHGHQ